MKTHRMLPWLCVAALGCRTDGVAEAADDGGAAGSKEPALEARPDPVPSEADEQTLAAVGKPSADDAEGGEEGKGADGKAVEEPADGEAAAKGDAAAKGEDAKADADGDAAGDPASADAGTAAADEATKAKADDADAPKQKVLILGDSLAATGFGAVLEKQLDARDGVVCYRKGKSASGLARPDFYDWVAEGKRQVDLREPELVVVIMGGNDGQDLTRRKRSKGKRVRWKAEGWDAEYRARMDAFIEEISAPGRKILWLGLPTMGLTSFERKLTLIRRIQKEAVDAANNATYLDTTSYLSDADGKMLKEARVGKRRKLQVLRAPDRIHFTMPGSQYFADKVYPEVLGALNLEP